MKIEIVSFVVYFVSFVNRKLKHIVSFIQIPV